MTFTFVYTIADYIFDYLTILVAVGGFSLVSTFHQALKYTFKVIAWNVCIISILPRVCNEESVAGTSAHFLKI